MDAPRSGVRPALLVDARALTVSGIGRFLREVLCRLIPDSRFERISLVGDVDELKSFAVGIPGAERLSYESCTARFYSVRVQLEWLRLIRRPEYRSCTAFFPHFDAPVLGMPARSVVTVQDLIHFMVPEVFPASRRHLAGVVLNRVTARARRIIVSSESTRRDLVNRLPAVDEKVSVVPFGVNSQLFSEDDDRSEAAIPPSWRPYVLCVGNRKPHKNLIAAVEAISRLPAAFDHVKLVLAGPTFRGGDLVERKAAELGLSNRVIELGAVSEPMLRSLYRRAEILLFPSIYEGFGLPPLEAMAAGTPVLASNSSSIGEVVGDAGILVDPHDYQGMADGIVAVLSDPSLRELLVRRGCRRAAELTWDETARQVIDILLESSTGPRSARNTRGSSGSSTAVIGA